jgi:hypothetical protein
MLIETLANSNLLLAFLALILAGAIAAEAGARYVQRVAVTKETVDDDLMSQIVVAPILGLFALLLAFTFGQAIALQEARVAALLGAKQASAQVKSQAAMLPEAARDQLLLAAGQYDAQLQRQIGGQSEIPDELAHTLQAMNKIVLATLKPNTSDVVVDHLLTAIENVLTANNALQQAAASRIPKIVLALQLLYYVLSFFLTGHLAASKNAYARHRFATISAAALFSIPLYLVTNLGRPGLHSLVLDKLQ